ncbi:MAG TPA: cytochrome c oxidase subunit II [Pseudonocardiaceae bacterium]
MVDGVRSRAARLVKLGGLLGLLGFASAGCSVHDAFAFGWPQGITPQAESMRALWVYATWAALAVGAIVLALILWTVTFHRKRTDEMPRQTQYNLPLEIVYTVIPFVIVAVLFYFTATTQNYVNAKIDNPDLRIKVVGFQWNWEFQYLENRKDGKGDFPVRQTRIGTPVSTVGSSSTVPLLVVPTNRVVEYRIESKDVLHSFYVPEFLFKRDVFPDPDKNDTDKVFQNTVEREGAFVGRCAELCGTYHSMMNFEVRALRPALFDQYMALRTRINPQTQQPYTAAEALAQMNCGALCAPEAVTTSPFDTSRTSGQPSGLK